MNITVEVGADGSLFLTAHDQEELEAIRAVFFAEDTITEEDEEEPDEDPDTEELGPITCPHPTVYEPPSERAGQCCSCGEQVEPPPVQEALAKLFGAECEVLQFPNGFQPVREFTPIEVPARHFAVLQQVLRRRGGTHRRTIARRCGMTPQAVSNSLGFLKGKGLVERVEGHWWWKATAKARAREVVAA